MSDALSTEERLDEPPFTVKRYGAFGAATCAELRWLHRVFNHPFARLEKGKHAGRCSVCRLPHRNPIHV